MSKANTMPAPPEIIVVDANSHTISCDGGGAALGHPRVFYSFDGGDSVECKYCDRLFVLEGSAAAKTAKGKKTKKAS